VAGVWSGAERALKKSHNERAAYYWCRSCSVSHAWLKRADGSWSHSSRVRKCKGLSGRNKNYPCPEAHEKQKEARA
jgi:hypothetical protein